MNNIKVLALLLVSVFIYSCSDSGGSVTPQNKGSLSVTKLQPIDKNVVGTYELWGSIVTSFDHDENAFRSMGRFVVTGTGALTDTSGNPFTPNMGKISNINNVSDVIITIQPPGYFDTIPSNIKILGGAKHVSGSEVIFDLTMGYSDIFPQSNLFPGKEAKYILASPTTGTASSQYDMGIWFTTDTTGNIAGITLPELPDTTEWTYQAWVIDNTSSYYNMGRFDSPNERDNYQQCELTGGLIWNHPGQDWLQPNCPGGGLYNILSLNNGNRVLVTLEPRFEQGIALWTPFFLKIFEGDIAIQPFGTVQSTSNVFSANLPTAQVRLSAN